MFVVVRVVIRTMGLNRCSIIAQCWCSSIIGQAHVPTIIVYGSITITRYYISTGV